MDNPRIKLTKAELERYEMPYPCNSVLVRMPPAKDLLVSGIKINFNEDTLYAEGEDSHVADVAPVMGWIEKQVDRLYFNRKDTARSMTWDTDLETQVGDQVWFHAFVSKNCVELEVEGTVYKVIPYEDLFVAIREWETVKGTTTFMFDDNSITEGEYTNEIETETICLNGNVLLDEVLIPKLSKFDVSPDTVDKTKGIVAYNGSDNKRYLAKESADLSGLKKGDMVTISERAYVFYLERSKYNSTFDGGRPYICIQGRYLDAKI